MSGDSDDPALLIDRYCTGLEPKPLHVAAAEQAALPPSARSAAPRTPTSQSETTSFDSTAREGIIAGLPGSQIQLVDTFGSGDRIAARFVHRGRHDGELMGAPATGREVEVNGTTILAFRDGHVIERWAVADMLGMLVQIGVVPPPVS